MSENQFKTGNSIIVSLPRDITEPLGVSEGTAVSVELDCENRQIIIRPAEHPIARDVDELYPDEFQKAAALLESLINNHPFVDGNKRTGITAAAMFLKINN